MMSSRLRVIDREYNRRDSTRLPFDFNREQVTRYDRRRVEVPTESEQASLRHAARETSEAYYRYLIDRFRQRVIDFNGHPLPSTPRHITELINLIRDYDQFYYR